MLTLEFFFPTQAFFDLEIQSLAYVRVPYWKCLKILENCSLERVLVIEELFALKLSEKIRSRFWHWFATHILRLTMRVKKKKKKSLWECIDSLRQFLRPVLCVLWDSEAISATYTKSNLPNNDYNC